MKIRGLFPESLDVARCAPYRERVSDSSMERHRATTVPENFRSERPSPDGIGEQTRPFGRCDGRSASTLSDHAVDRESVHTIRRQNGRFHQRLFDRLVGRNQRLQSGCDLCVNYEGLRLVTVFNSFVSAMDMIRMKAVLLQDRFCVSLCYGVRTDSVRKTSRHSGRSCASAGAALAQSLT